MQDNQDLLWRLTPEEETVMKMIRGLRNNPDTREEAMYEALYRMADRATENYENYKR